MSVPSPSVTWPRALGVLVALGALLVAAGVLSLGFGEYPLSFAAALKDRTSTDAAVLFSLRLPRTWLGIVVGCALGASGSALQSVLRNPLADPFILGVSGGAALGATVAILLGLSGWGALAAPSAFAFLGSAGAVLLVFVAVRGRGAGGPYAALLTGVIFNAFASAAITCIKTLTSPEKIGEILYWLVGALGYEQPKTLALTTVLELVSLAVLFGQAPSMNLLSLGDEDAASLGVHVQRTRTLVLLSTSVAVAAAVTLSGLIGFVGLIVPQFLRLWLGPDQRLLLPASALGGAAFLVSCDLGTRLAFPVFHAEPPVGVLTAIVGGPLFLWLLNRRRATPL